MTSSIQFWGPFQVSGPSMNNILSNGLNTERATTVWNSSAAGLRSLPPSMELYLSSGSFCPSIIIRYIVWSQVDQGSGTSLVAAVQQLQSETWTNNMRTGHVPVIQSWGGRTSRTGRWLMRKGNDTRTKTQTYFFLHGNVLSIVHKGTCAGFWK